MDTIFSDAPLWIMAICLFAIVIVATIFVIRCKRVSNKHVYNEYQSNVNNKELSASHQRTIRKFHRIEIKGMPRFLLILFGVCSIMSLSYCICNLFGAPVKLVEKGTNIVDMGLIIGVFSLLVTLLVTWQIVQSIISKEQINNLENRIDKSAQNTLNVNLYNVFLLQGHNERRLNNPESALNYYIRALDCACKENGNKQWEHINELMRVIHGMIESRPNVQINSEEAGWHIDVVSQIEHRLKNDIVEFIRKHSSKDAPRSSIYWSNGGIVFDRAPNESNTVNHKPKKLVDPRKFPCPLCGSKKVYYSSILYQLPYNSSDYDIDKNMSHMPPAKCLYGECGDCGYVILRNIKPLLAPVDACGKTPG